MSDYIITAGATSRRISVWLADSSSTTGAGLAGLAFNTASLTCYYWREDEGNAGATAVTLATATRGTFTSSGFIEKDATNMPGEYEFGLPNAAIASGAKWVKVMFKGAANLAPRVITIKLAAFDQDTASVAQTGDNYARLGAPAGASTAADIASIKTDTGTTIPGRLPAALAADGSIKASLSAILGTAFTEGAAGRIAANLKTFFNVGSATGTQDVIPTTTTVTSNVNADIKKINGTTVNGDGSGTPWGP